jgi:hypothetical protein
MGGEMTHASGLEHNDTGQTARIIFLPPRYYKPKAEWTDEDWQQDWAARVRHRRSVKNWRTWQEGRDHVRAMRGSLSEDFESDEYVGSNWYWVLFIGLCALVVVASWAFGSYVQPITFPAVP